MSGHERSPQAPDLTVPAALADGRARGPGRAARLLQRGPARCAASRATIPASRSTSRCAARRRCGTSPTARCTDVRSPRSSWPTRWGGRACRRRCSATVRTVPARSSCSCRSTPRTTSSRSRWSTPTCSGAWRCSTSRRTTRIARAATACSTRTGTIWMIDHGVCFAVEPKLRTVIWTFVGEPLPEDAAADLERVRGELSAGGRRGRDAAARCSIPRRSRPSGIGSSGCWRTGGFPTRSRVFVRTHGRRSDPSTGDRCVAAGAVFGRHVAGRRRRHDE